MGFVFLVIIFIIVRVIIDAQERAGDQGVRRRFGVYRQEEAPRRYHSQHGGLMFAATKGTYQRLAQSLGGQYIDTGPRGMPRVTFKHRDGTGLITVVQPGPDVRFERTQLTFIKSGGFDERLEVLRQAIPDAQIRQRRIQDIRIGDAAFDPRFIIKGENEAATREFFTPAVTSAIEAIRALGPGDNVVFSINAQRLRIEKSPPLQSRNDLVALVSAAKVLFDRSDELTSPAGSVEFVSESSGETPVCQVCGAEVTSNRVDCAQCATPHHSDCWDFNGRCSTYGCGERGCRPFSG